MNLMDLQTIQKLSIQYGLRPSRKHGQNFLVDQAVLDAMVEAAKLKPDDVILEIGPGFGTLTVELARRVRRVIAVEQDRILVKALTDLLQKEQINNVEIFEGNVLRIKNQELRIKNYRVVANLPYQITSRFLRVFLEQAEVKPVDMTLMVQKEVAERITALPGNMSLLAVSVQFFGTPEIVRLVSSSSFWPEPDVDSAVLRIALRNAEELQSLAEVNYFFKIVRNGFLHRRQKLINNLSSIFHIDKEDVRKAIESIGLEENTRAQELSVDQWVKLTKQLARRER
ncbi:MAG TPA: 16S rRNA (adenine(1518)-N(6)/adenine(1519)-N(6))-dimethyltransferase RsmA [Patescibacteria group bacterium]|nr:16S rRNA (adenine(1518)-N(6)/adenine(1519)-N(6))-dimethyltransferase RsmA [Patescibacteria group bacterium]